MCLEGGDHSLMSLRPVHYSTLGQYPGPDLEPGASALWKPRRTLTTPSLGRFVSNFKGSRGLFLV